MLELLSFTGRRAGALPCVLSREKGVATYFADSDLLSRVTVLLLLRQDFAPWGFEYGAIWGSLRQDRTMGRRQTDLWALSAGITPSIPSWIFLPPSSPWRSLPVVSYFLCCFSALCPSQSLLLPEYTVLRSFRQTPWWRVCLSCA